MALTPTHLTVTLDRTLGWLSKNTDYLPDGAAAVIIESNSSLLQVGFLEHTSVLLSKRVRLLPACL